MESPEILALLLKTENSWLCKACGYMSRVRTRALLHVEAIHVNTGGHNCPHCVKLCPSKNALNAHMSRYHRKKKNYPLPNLD